MWFLLWALSPWLLALPVLAPLYAARRITTAASVAVKAGWNVFKLLMRRQTTERDQGPPTAREPAVARGSFRWEARQDDRVRPHRHTVWPSDTFRVQGNVDPGDQDAATCLQRHCPAHELLDDECD